MGWAVKKKVWANYEQLLRNPPILYYWHPKNFSPYGITVLQTVLVSIPHNEIPLDKDSEEKVDCAKCLDIPHAFCLAEPDDEPMKVRLDFDDMVEKMTKDPENKACSCAEGYLPIYHPESGYLMRCHDPIIKTATLGTNHNLVLWGK